MIRLGAALFVVGAVCTLVALLPLVTGEDLPSALWFLAMLTGLGFLLILLGLLRNAARRGADVRRAAAARPGS